MHLPQFLKHWLTEPDNQTFCPLRAIAILGSFQFLGMTAAHYVQHNVFDAQNFALGFGTLLAGTGAALGLKKDSAPPKQ